MFLKLSSLAALAAGASAADLPIRRHRLQTRLPKIRQTQVTSDLTSLLVNTQLGACGEAEPTEPYKIGDMMHVCVSTYDPAVISALTSVTATPSGGEAEELVDEVGDANLGTEVSGIETSEVTLSTLITLKYYYDAIASGVDPVITIGGTATVQNAALIAFEIDVPFTADADLASLGAGITTPAPSEICSCSPSVYGFTLDFSKDCSSDTLQENAGVEVTLCRDALGDVSTVTSIQFLEFDTSGNLVVINQDDSYFDTSLGDGDSFEYTSISAELDPSVGIEDQLDLVPGGAQLTLRGLDADGGDVVARYTWAFTNSCADDAVTVESGDEIGWVVLEPTPATAFCPASGSVSTTVAPETTSEASTTEAPETTTEAPETTTDAPETTTEAPGTTEGTTTGATGGATTTGATTTESAETTSAAESDDDIVAVADDDMSMSMSMSVSMSMGESSTTSTESAGTTSEATSAGTTTESAETTSSSEESTTGATGETTTEAPESTTEATTTGTTTESAETTSSSEESTTGATEEVSTTEATDATTEAAIETTEAPETTTEAPEEGSMSMSLSMAFSKSGKYGKASKTLKDATPKAGKADPKAAKISPEDRPSSKAGKVPKSQKGESSMSMEEVESVPSTLRENRLFPVRIRGIQP